MGESEVGDSEVGDVFGALRVGPATLATPTGDGDLSGLTFVVKDLFDIAGEQTGAGNPEVLAAAAPADRHAPCVESLLLAGATCIGKAHTVETAYALSGVNDHYGTPKNPVAQDRDPGGSSSGSAVAVAAGLCDFALGTDTAGSVRVPASYCGLVGMRPTHGRVPLDGVFPLAPRFDTVGWITRTGAAARQVGRVLLDAPAHPVPLRRLLVATDLFGFCEDGHAEHIQESVSRISAVLGVAPEPVQFWEGSEAREWLEAFRTLQRFDAWRTNRDWIEQVGPSFGPAVADRWVEAAAVTDADNADAEALALRLSARAWELLSGGTVVVAPSVPGPAPLLGVDSASAAATRRRLLALTVIAPIARAPQVSLPLMQFGDLPVGVGLLGAPGADELLLDLAEMLA